MPDDPRPRPVGIHETVVYAPDLDAADAFYAGALGLRRISDMGELSRAYRVDDRSVLLVFDGAASGAPGRAVPSHGPTGGTVHVAFRVEPGSLGAWRDTLARAGVAIEQEIEWPTGARSIYVRDPAGSSVELIDGELWPP